MLKIASGQQCPQYADLYRATMNQVAAAFRGQT